jgi:hypothetical protein
MSTRFKIATITDITTFGDSLAKSIRMNLAWSKKLRSSVVLTKATERDGRLNINIEVGAKGTDASGNPLGGMARAYEYGSGVHGENGMTYPIVPKRAKNLVFWWKREGVLFKGKHVEHPGVAPRPYLQKSIDSTLPKATDELAMNIRTNIVNSFNVEIREMDNANLR